MSIRLKIKTSFICRPFLFTVVFQNVTLWFIQWRWLTLQQTLKECGLLWQRKENLDSRICRILGLIVDHFTNLPLSCKEQLPAGISCDWKRCPWTDSVQTQASARPTCLSGDTWRNLRLSHIYKSRGEFVEMSSPRQSLLSAICQRLMGEGWPRLLKLGLIYMMEGLERERRLSLLMKEKISFCFNWIFSSA